MRTLSEEEIDEEIGFILDFAHWPLYPILPVKNIHRGTQGHPEDEEIGFMLTGQYAKVYLKNMMELEQGPITPQLEGVRVLEFASVDDLVKAGWIGD